MCSIRDAILNAVNELQDIDTNRLDAEILLAHVLNQSRSYLIMQQEAVLSEEQLRTYSTLIARRKSGEPIAYLVGEKEFWSLNFAVNQHVLIPRADTETLVETVLNRFSNNKKISLADLGTGSGAIACAIANARPAWDIHAVDVSSDALQVAMQNAKQLQLRNITFHLSDWFSNLNDLHFDVIVSNPPYIAESEWQDYASGLRFEPRAALVSGSDGLNDIRLLIENAKSHLVFEGVMLIEHGFKQGEAVRALFTEHGYAEVITQCDFSGNERVTLGKWMK